MKTVVIAGLSYSVRACQDCAGTGKSHDSTNADKVNVGPYAGHCGCRNGEVLTNMPSIELAEILAHAENDLLISRMTAPVGEMPEWMF